MGKSALPIRGIYRRYYREFFPAMAGYVLYMLFVWPYVRHIDDPFFRGAVALLPVLPIALVIRAMVRLVLGSDELEQRTHLVGLAVATAVVAVLSLAGGFLAAAHVLQLDGNALLMVFPTLMMAYAAGRSWANRRYGVNDLCAEESHMREEYFALAGVVLLLLAWLGNDHLKDYQVGMLTGMGAAFVVGAGIIGLVRRLRARANERDGD